MTDFPTLLIAKLKIHIDRSASGVSASNATLYRWHNEGWLAGQPFSAIGGKAWLSAEASAVQLLVPYTALGGADDNFSGSLALALLSMTDVGIRDSAPPQGAIYGELNKLDNYAYISDMLLPLCPFDAPLSNPDQFHEMPVLRWSMPYFDSVDGYQVQVDDDPTFGSPLINVKTAATFYTPTKGQSLSDGIWYWRVALSDAHNRNGPFSPAIMFGKQYLIPTPVGPQNGGTVGSVPSFAWESLEGAAYYEITYANNPAFTNATKATTVSSTHTPVKNLSSGRYYWYVQMFDQDKKGGPIIAHYFDFGHAVYLPLTLR